MTRKEKVELIVEYLQRLRRQALELEREWERLHAEAHACEKPPCLN